jgi:hypothetical protein
MPPAGPQATLSSSHRLGCRHAIPSRSTRSHSQKETRQAKTALSGGKANDADHSKDWPATGHPPADAPSTVSQRSQCSGMPIQGCATPALRCLHAAPMQRPSFALLAALRLVQAMASLPRPAHEVAAKSKPRNSKHQRNPKAQTTRIQSSHRPRRVARRAVGGSQRGPPAVSRHRKSNATHVSS